MYKQTRTSIGEQHARRPTQRTLALPAFLHLHQTAHTEQMATRKSDRLERDTRTYQARVIVQTREDGKKRIGEGRDEHLREVVCAGLGDGQDREGCRAR